MRCARVLARVMNRMNAVHFSKMTKWQGKVTYRHINNCVEVLVTRFLYQNKTRSSCSATLETSTQSTEIQYLLTLQVR